MSSRAELVIDLSTIAANYRKIAEYAAPCIPVPVVKADAYNMGAVQVARALKNVYAPFLMVATLNEALELRSVGLPLQIVGGILPHEIRTAIAARVTCPVNDLQAAQRISAEAESQKEKVNVHIQIDTGMGRDGIPVAEAASAIRDICALPRLVCSGIYSHFPGALPEFGEYTNDQISKFKMLLGGLDRRFDFVHFGGSDGVGHYAEILKPPFTHCRAGLALYGLGPSAKVLNLQPVISLKSGLAQIRTLPGGSSIGYSFTHRLDRERRVGTVAIGYADGLPLALSNRGEVIVRGKRCRILGRVSMDYTNIDLSEVPDAEVGDEVICLGGGITVDDWAAAKQTHPHEILCSLGRRLTRSYLN